MAKKIFSVLLIFALVFSTSLTALSVSSDYTEQYLGTGFTRLSLTNQTFAANTAREFSVTIKQTGDYTVFVNNVNKTSTNFTVTFTKGVETLTICNNSTINSAYAYGYVRVGASSLTSSPSVTLTEGVWTLSVKSVAAITVGYIDIRTTSIEIDGSKQAIYPSDYNTTGNLASANYVNNDMNKTSYPRVVGYEYFADYTNATLGNNTFSYGRGIHLGLLKTVSYKLNVQAAGKYKIILNGQFYLMYTSSRAAEVKLSIDGSQESVYSYTFADSSTAGAKSDKKEYVYICELEKGENILSITSGGSTSDVYIYSLTAENYNPAEANTYVLAKDSTINYMADAKRTYPNDAAYSTSVVSNYAGSNSANYYDRPKAVTLSWSEKEDVDKYTILISETEDFSDDIIEITDVTTCTFDVYNLKSDTVYYYRVTANSEILEESAFYTADTVRWINIDGMRNVRDIGGWNGLNQGMAYRGSAMDPGEDLSVYEGIIEITEAGKKTMREDLGIKTDLDFRWTLNESPLGSDINFVKLPVSAYTYAYTGVSTYKSILETFANIDNYPIYFHCSGGADRTGTVAFLIESLCGVSEEDISIDYELTSFANCFGPRRRNSTSYAFAETVAKMKEYEGDTLKEKAENYALSTLGLTRAQISNIQSILAGNKVVFSSALDLPVNKRINVRLKNLGNHTIKSVTNEGVSVPFSLSGDLLTVTLNSVGTGEITFDDDNVLKFNAADVGDYTQNYLGDGFTRLDIREEVNTFLAGETRNFDFTLQDGGDYAVFMGKTQEANDFTVSLTNKETEETKVICTSGHAAKNDYGYSYIRLGVSNGSESGSVSLESGEYTISVTALVDTTVTNIDIRSTILNDAGGYARAFYPSDYHTYSSVYAYDTVNGEMNKTEANSERLNGYSYCGDMTDSRLYSTYNYDRGIYHASGTSISYKLDITKTGVYDLRLYHIFDTSDGSVKLSLNGEEVERFTSDDDYAQMRCNVATLNLEAGINTLTLHRTASGGNICHIALELGKNEADKVVTVDNNLTRIEVDTETKTLAVGDTRGYDFTVPADGSYAFYTRFSETESYKANVIVKNMTDGITTNVFSGEIPKNNYGTQYKRLGNETTQGVELKQGKEYRLYFTLNDEYGGSDTAENNKTALEFIDVINLSLPINGKTAIGAHYFSSTSITLTSDMNQSDQAYEPIVVNQGKCAMPEPEPGYTLVGDFRDNRLAAEKAFKNKYFALTPLMAKGKSLSYTLMVEEPGYYTLGADIVGNDNKNDYQQLLAFKIDGEEKGVAVNTADIENVRNRHVGPSVYLSQGVHTLTLENKADSSASGTIFLVQILLTPKVKIDTVVLNGLSEGVELGTTTSVNDDGKISLLKKYIKGNASYQGYASWNFTPTQTGIYKISSERNVSAALEIIQNGNVLHKSSSVYDYTIELEENQTYKIFVYSEGGTDKYVKSVTISYINEAKDITKESYEIAYECNKDIQYSNRYDASATKYDYTKTITVPYNANYTLSLNAGISSDIEVYVYVERIDGGKVTLKSTGGIENITERVLYTDLPLEAYKTYKVSIFNATNGSTLRVEDIILKSSGEYNLNTESVSILGSHYSTGNIEFGNKGAFYASAAGKSYPTTYSLKLSAGNYKVSAEAKAYAKTPECDFMMYVDGKGAYLYDVVSGTLNNKETIDLGTISVTDKQFTLKFELLETFTTNQGIYLYEITVERIDEPVVTIHSEVTPSATNVVSALQEGTLTARAYIPEAEAGKPVTVLFAIYNSTGSLYKVGSTTIESAEKNQVVDVPISDIAFDEGKKYTSKVFFFDNMKTIKPYYKASGILSGEKAEVTE